MRLAARIISQQLDRSKPLWEMWIVEGLEDGRFALISKTHHALVDGVSGVDLATVLFDLAPVPPQCRTRRAVAAAARADAAPSCVAGGALGLRASRRSGAAASALERRAQPGSATLRALREAAEGIGEVVWAGLNPAPETPLNVEIGPHRRYAVVRNQLDDFKDVKDAFGGTVNDVVLTVVSRRAARLAALARRAHRGPRAARARARSRSAPRTSSGHARQPHRGDARAAAGLHRATRSRGCASSRQAMDGLKESKQAVGAEVLAGVQSFAPPTILAQASRLNFSTRLFNLIVTNVPGPQFPLYVLGREMHDVFPVAFLPKDHALAIAIMSYNGADELRPARRLRRAARHRRHRRRHRGVAGRAAGAGAQAPSAARTAGSSNGGGRAPGSPALAPGDADARVGLGRRQLAVARVVDGDREEAVQRAALAAQRACECARVVAILRGLATRPSSARARSARRRRRRRRRPRRRPRASAAGSCGR